MVERDKAGEQYVLFVSGGTQFAAPVIQVLRITRRLPMTRVPRAPAFLEGVINDHSQVVPVVDLRKRMALPATGYDGAREKILILTYDDQLVGLLVDDVLDIVRVPGSEIQPPPAMVAQVNGVYLTGVTRVQDRVTLLLDLARILTLDEVSQVRDWQVQDSQVRDSHLRDTQETD